MTVAASVAAQHSSTDIVPMKVVTASAGLSPAAIDARTACCAASGVTSLRIAAMSAAVSRAALILSSAASADA